MDAVEDDKLIGCADHQVAPRSRPASTRSDSTGGGGGTGKRGSIHSGEARKPKELRQFSLGKSPQIRDSSSVVIGSSESQTASWKTSGSVSGDAASMARMASPSAVSRASATLVSPEGAPVVTR